ncbi:hypothetical protein QBC44DRAFT_308599 [Cladorrhinum sp. PSN332]|nr:hypothetical protein QBC44DRAFT_308599 [Cladorrhinum sp. PSN332]
MPEPITEDPPTTNGIDEGHGSDAASDSTGYSGDTTIADDSSSETSEVPTLIIQTNTNGTLTPRDETHAIAQRRNHLEWLHLNDDLTPEPRRYEKPLLDRSLKIEEISNPTPGPAKATFLSHKNGGGFDRDSLQKWWSHPKTRASSQATLEFSKSSQLTTDPLSSILYSVTRWTPIASNRGRASQVSTTTAVRSRRRENVPHRRYHQPRSIDISGIHSEWRWSVKMAKLVQDLCLALSSRTRKLQVLGFGMDFLPISGAIAKRQTIKRLSAFYIWNPDDLIGPAKVLEAISKDHQHLEWLHIDEQLSGELGNGWAWELRYHNSVTSPWGNSLCMPTTGVVATRQEPGGPLTRKVLGYGPRPTILH